MRPRKNTAYIYKFTAKNKYNYYRLTTRIGGRVKLYIFPYTYQGLREAEKFCDFLCLDLIYNDLGSLDFNSCGCIFQ